MDLDALTFGKQGNAGKSQSSQGKGGNGKGYDQSGIPQCKYCLKRGHAPKERRKAAQDMKDGKITKEELWRISEGKGKGKDNNNKTKTLTPKTNDKAVSYLGPDYDAEEGYIFMIEASEDEELDHNAKLDHNEDTEKGPNYD
eukprot:267889-Pyramimonas_sp.AAC.1